MCSTDSRLWISLLLAAVFMPAVAAAQMLDETPEAPPPPPRVQAMAPVPVALEAAPEALPDEPTPTPPAAQKPQQAPEAQLATPPAAVIEDSFKAALTNVYANHPALKAQREALAAIDEGVAQAVSGFRPTVEAGYDRGRQRSKTGTNREWLYKDNTAKTLDISQPVFSGGETWANFKGAKDRVKAGRAQLKDVEQQVLYNAVVAFSDVAEKKSVLKLNQNNVDVLRRQLEATRSRFDVGELTRTDVAQAESRLSTAQADERQALGDLEIAYATFKRNIGYDAPDIQDMPVTPAALLPQDMDQAIAWAQQGNPLLESAKFTESAFSNDIDARVGALLPEVSVNGGVSRADNGNIPGVSRYDRDSLTLNVSIPLYQSGAEWSRVREARNLANEAKFNTMDTHHAVTEDATRAWQGYTTARAVIVSTEEAMKAAEVALEGVRQENQYGVRTILDVLDAEQELFTSRVNLVKAVRSEKVQAYRLLAAVGKLTAQDLALNVPTYDPKEHYDNVKYQLIGF